MSGNNNDCKSFEICIHVAYPIYEEAITSPISLNCNLKIEHDSQALCSLSLLSPRPWSSNPCNHSIRNKVICVG